MILFKSDWERYPTAIVDYKTTNKSFLRLAALYRNMGVDNCEFLLALYQPELVGVDPHDPDLTLEQKKMVRMEAQYNPWYFFREVLRVPVNSGTVAPRFKANRGNIAMIWSFFNHIDFGLLQPRQSGKSVSTDGLMTGVKDVWATNTNINLITKDATLRLKNIQRLKEYRDLLPDYIYYPNPKDPNNTEMLANLSLKNYYNASVGRSDIRAADKLGRGLTVPILHFDELAYISLIEHSLPVALSSGSAARDEAAANGQMYGNIYTTTAGQLNSRDGGYAHDFLTGGAPWSERLMDLPDQPTLVDVVKKRSSGPKPLIYGAFSHRQLGYSDEWMMRKLSENAMVMGSELADRDMFNIWTTGTEGSPITTEDKQRIKGSEREPNHIEITPENYTLSWFIPRSQIAEKMATGSFIMGLDLSEGLGGDNDASGLVVMDAYTHDTIVTGRFSESNTTQLGMFIANFMATYEKVILVPERKSMGIAILDTLFIQLPLHGIDPFRRIYNRIVDEQDTRETEMREISRPVSSRPSYFYDKYKRYFGFNTSGSGRHAREELYGRAFNDAIRLGGKRVYDQTLIQELLSLRMKNGRIDHANGKHDDMVVSWLLAHWFATQGRHLDWYGIRAARVFSEAVHSESEMDSTQKFHRERNQLLQSRLESHMENLREANDPAIIKRLEHQIRHLSSDVDISDASGGEGIDAMIRQAQEERLRRQKLNRTNSTSIRSRLRGRHLGAMMGAGARRGASHY